MGLTLDSADQHWPQIFRQLVVSNSFYWLNLAQNDVSRLGRELPQVLKALTYGLSLPEAWRPARDLMLLISPFLIRQGYGAEWESLLTRGIARGPEENDSVELDFLLQLGTLYRLQGRLAEAYRCLQQALILCEQYDRRQSYWTLANQLGLVARLSARHEEALAYCQQVLAEPTVPIPERAEALNVMGLVAYDRRQWDEAMDYLEQALSLYRSLDNSYQMARILTNQGVILQRIGRLDEAEQCCQNAILQFRLAGDQTEIFKAIMNLGNVFLARQTYEAAIKQYQEALTVFKQRNFLIDLANVFNNLGMAYTGLADWKTAEHYFRASVEAYQRLQDAYNLANVLDNLGHMFMKANQSEYAEEVLNQALQVLTTASASPANTYLQQVVRNRLTQLKETS